MPKQAGFTLIEIALVLVILGLLIGAGVKGVVMIDNAKVKRMVSDATDYPIGIRAYESTRGSLFDVVTDPNDIIASSNQMRMALVNMNLIADKPRHPLIGDILLIKSRSNLVTEDGNVPQLALNNNSAIPAYFRWGLCFTNIVSENDVRALIRAVDGKLTGFSGAINGYNTGRARIVNDSYEAVPNYELSNQTLCIALDNLL